jgi:flap endonuclease-1
MFNGKTIVIDTSIYMYKFKSTGCLLENMKKFICLLLEYNITPLFIFDGKPKINKQKELVRRKEQKEVAYNKYKQLSISDPTSSKLVHLKQQCTRVSKSDVIQVQELMTSLHVHFNVAIYEADEVCALYTRDDKVYACVSDDMDMFIYGCSNIIRNVDIHARTAQLYNLHDILQSLHMSHDTFKQICVIAGNDYYKSSNNLYTYLELYKEFLNENEKDFYQWLKKRSLIENYDSLLDAYDIFDLTKSPNVLMLLEPEQPPSSGNADSCTSEG